jgi:hypothetical protein
MSSLVYRAGLSRYNWTDHRRHGHAGTQVEEHRGREDGSRGGRVSEAPKPAMAKSGVTRSSVTVSGEIAGCHRTRIAVFRRFAT